MIRLRSSPKPSSKYEGPYINPTTRLEPLFPPRPQFHEDSDASTATDVESHESRDGRPVKCWVAAKELDISNHKIGVYSKNTGVPYYSKLNEARGSGFRVSEFRVPKLSVRSGFGSMTLGAEMKCLQPESNY